MSRKIILINNLKTTKIVLLVCGLSASSGFIAVNMRKASKKVGLDYKIQVCREAEFSDYADQIAALMLGFLLKDGVWCD